MESRGEFTIEGCIEMAWLMGFIKHFDGRLKDGPLYVGWVERRTNSLMTRMSKAVTRGNPPTRWYSSNWYERLPFLSLFLFFFLILD